jgi:hypothetical protein
MKSYGEVDIYSQIHFFLTSVLAGDEWPDSRPGLFTALLKGKGPRYPLHRTGLEDMEERKCVAIPGQELRSF